MLILTSYVALLARVLSFVLSFYSAQQYLGKISCRLFVRDVDHPPLFVPQDIVQRVMYQHSKKRSYGDPWIDLTKGALLLPPNHIIADKVIHPLDKVAEKLRRQLMLLKCRVKDQPHEA